MHDTARYLSAGAIAVALAAGVFDLSELRSYAQAPAQGARPAQTQPPQTPAQGQPTFRVAVDLVTTDVIVRDSKTDQFIADLKTGDFEVYEDGVKQDLSSLVLIHGGRAFNVQAPPPPPAQEGILLPQSRPTNDTAGRIFLIFFDDLHLEFSQTSRLRDIFKKLSKELIHEGDMFGIVSTGTSSLSVQLTYDRQVLEDSIKRVTGGGLKPSDIITGLQSSDSELRYRAHVAFSTAYDLMKNLEKVHNRRKAVIWFSSGYDFNPFEQARLNQMAQGVGVSPAELASDPFYNTQQQGNTFAQADLVRELSEVTKAANRANATLYTIDPRGLVAGPDIGETELANAVSGGSQNNVDDWNKYLQETQDSLRILAEQTGGIAVVNQNNFDKALKRIDAETSDYYVLGYYSSNPDPLRRVRKIEVKTRRDGLTVWSRTSYSLRPTPGGAQ